MYASACMLSVKQNRTHHAMMTHACILPHAKPRNHMRDNTGSNNFHVITDYASSTMPAMLAKETVSATTASITGLGTMQQKLHT